MEIAEAQARLLELASEVAECAEGDDVVKRLLKLQDILDQCPLGGPTLSAVRRQTVECGLLQACIDALAQEPAGVVAGRLALLVANCLVGLRLSSDHSLSTHERDQDTETDLLPAACHSLLACGVRIQQAYQEVGSTHHRRKHRSASENNVTELRRSLLTSLVNVTDSLVALCSWRPAVAGISLHSPDVLALVGANSASSGVVVFSALLHVVRIAAGVPGNFDDRHALLAFVDAIFNRLSAALTQIQSISVVSGSSRRSQTQLRLTHLASQIILLYVDEGAVEADVLCGRYHDIAPLSDLNLSSGAANRLISMLRRASAVHQHQQKQVDAAVCIQRHWRGYKQCCHWSKVLSAVTTLQYHWRRRRKRQQAFRHREILERQELFMKETQRHQQLVERKKQEMNLLHCIPAQDIDKFLTNRAAIVLQTHWRGWLARKRTTSVRKKEDVRRQNIAASQIQRAFRRHVQSKQLIKEKKIDLISSNLLDGINDQRRLELQRLVMHHRQQNPYSFQSMADLQQLHDQVQVAWASFCSHAARRKQQAEQIDSLIARLETDLNDLASMPDLASVQPADIDRFASHSSAIATVAMEKHQQKLASLRSRWWEMPANFEADWILPTDTDPS